MANRNYIPSKLGDRQLWYQNFSDYIAANFLAIGLLEADATLVIATNNAFQAAYQLAQTAETRTAATIAAMVTADNAMRTTARQYSQVVNNNPATTDEQRASMQITIRTAPPFGRISAPDTWPVMSIRSIGPLQHTLQYHDSSFPSNTKNRSKPFGAANMALYMHVGATPPADPAASVFVGNFTRMPVTVEHDPASAGQTAFYYARWVTARGLTGPLVGPVSATVAASAS